MMLLQLAIYHEQTEQYSWRKKGGEHQTESMAWQELLWRSEPKTKNEEKLHSIHVKREIYNVLGEFLLGIFKLHFYREYTFIYIVHIVFVHTYILACG